VNRTPDTANFTLARWIATKIITFPLTHWDGDTSARNCNERKNSVARNDFQGHLRRFLPRANADQWSPLTPTDKTGNFNPMNPRGPSPGLTDAEGGRGYSRWHIQLGPDTRRARRSPTVVRGTTFSPLRMRPVVLLVTCWATGFGQSNDFFRPFSSSTNSVRSGRPGDPGHTDPGQFALCVWHAKDPLDAPHPDFSQDLTTARLCSTTSSSLGPGTRIVVAGRDPRSGNGGRNEIACDQAMTDHLHAPRRCRYCRAVSLRSPATVAYRANARGRRPGSGAMPSKLAGGASKVHPWGKPNCSATINPNPAVPYTLPVGPHHPVLSDYLTRIFHTPTGADCGSRVRTVGATGSRMDAQNRLARC